MHLGRMTGRPHRSLLLLTMLGCLAIAQPAAGATLVAEWPLDEGAGQIAHDSSPSALDARLG